jgi:hypothetical protein
MGLDWTVCAWCGHDFGQPVLSQPLPARRTAGDGDRVAAYRPQTEVARI